MRICAADRDIVVEAVDVVLEALEDGKLSKDDARGQILGLIDSAALDSPDLVKLARTADKYGRASYV